MKKILISSIVIALLAAMPMSTSAMMSPENKECMQRGYEVNYIQEENEKYCVFPDGEKCLLGEFNSGICGDKYKVEDYCIKEGDPVWDEDKCCEGLSPYSVPGIMGHPTCEKNSKKFSNLLNWQWWFSNWYFGAGLLIIIGGIIFAIKKRK